MFPVGAAGAIFQPSGLIRSLALGFASGRHWRARRGRRSHAESSRDFYLSPSTDPPLALCAQMAAAAAANIAHLFNKLYLLLAAFGARDTCAASAAWIAIDPLR